MQAAIEEGDGVQLELLQVGQVQELGHELTDAILLLVGGSVRQHVNVPEQQPAQVVHPAQVQHEPAQWPASRFSSPPGPGQSPAAPTSGYP